MLLAFVLLGRSLERQAQLRAQTDLKALATLLPSNSRLVLNCNATGAPFGDRPLQTAEVPTQMIRIGDIVQVRNFHLSNIVLEPCYLIPSCAGTARGVDAVRRSCAGRH